MNIGDVRISRGMIGAALVMFFFPFITVSCGGQDITLTGSQLATGTAVMGQPMPPQFDVVLSVLAALIALGATWLYGRFGTQVATAATAIFAGSGFGWLQFFKLRQDASYTDPTVPITISYNSGFWLASLLFLGVAGINVWNFVEYRRTLVAAPAPAYATTLPASGAETIVLEPGVVALETSGAGEQSRE